MKRMRNDWPGDDRPRYGSRLRLGNLGNKFSLFLIIQSIHKFTIFINIRLLTGKHSGFFFFFSFE